MIVMESAKEIDRLLPGFNCGACGYRECYDFALALLTDHVSINKCSVLNQQRFQGKKAAIQKLVYSHQGKSNPEIRGLIDRVKADFYLYPLENEHSCRETLLCFSRVNLTEGTVIRYRPLGCPIIHFARVIVVHHGLPDVWVIGPGKLLNRKDEAIDIGICMVLSFQGTIEGEMPKVGQTVKFLPAHCMMGKVHSGIIVQLENNKTRIDCIDLKVWQHTSDA
ncbi:MAG: (Fe-S)-binding protein [Mariniphaga sp.]|nr:(Fe-S)-binding protein [Mariniphaga sp.]